MVKAEVKGKMQKKDQTKNADEPGDTDKNDED
jgi:hypothetical protein